jgi:GTPase SAR1 family protein
VFVCAGESGKTSLVKQWVDGGFDSQQMPTLGSDKHVKYLAEPNTG